MENKTIKSLKALREAFITLNEDWGKLNETEAINEYPFDLSFDELSLVVCDWIDESVKELSSLESKK